MKRFLFDVDDTLYNMLDPFSAAFRSLYGEEHGELDLVRLFVLSRKYSDEVFEDTNTGRMTMEEMYIYRMKMACAEMGLDMSDEEALAFQRYYAENQGRIQLPEGIRTILDQLTKKGALLGIITNGPSEHQRKKIHALGLDRWFSEDRIFVSGDFDVAKPDPRIYEIAVEALGGKADDYIYIGDSLENDVVGPSRAGLHTIWLNKRNVVNDTGVEPDAAVTNDRELYELLMELTA